MDRDFVRMTVSCGEHYTKSITEEVNEIDQRSILSSALASLLSPTPLGVGANRIAVQWEYDCGEDPDFTVHGVVEEKIYRSTKIFSLAFEIAGEIIRDINNQHSDITINKKVLKLDKMLEVIENDDGLSKKGRDRSRSEILQLRSLLTGNDLEEELA